jgi:hypothetical protein
VGWRPGQRGAKAGLETPYEDLPEHLEDHVHVWLSNYLASSVEATRYVALTYRIAVSDVRRYHTHACDTLLQFAYDEPGNALDMLETLLGSAYFDPVKAAELGRMLTEANSAYALRPDGRGLEMRVLPETRSAVAAAVQQAADAGTVAEHLTEAWNSAFSRTPDPVKAYSESIKAVEAAAAPVVTPKNLKATLGTLLKDLESQRGKWVTVLATGGEDVDAVVVMMRTLWTGQTSRHGGVKPTVGETQEAAQAAVFLAATLVQWFISGAIRRA